MAEQSLLSIIITSYTTERLKDVYELLDSVKAQTYSNIETIFVAERSVELLDRVRAYAGGKDGLKVIFNDGQMGLSAARNLGIKAARGDIIAFVDDDALLFPDWAEEVVKSYADDSIIGVTGPAFPMWENESAADWFPEELYWIAGCTAWCDWNEIKEVRNAWGQGMSFRKEAFQVAGPFLAEIGFDKGRYRRGLLTEDVGDDVELSLRVKAKTGKRIVANPGVRLRHRVYGHRLSWRFIIKRAYWIGRSRRMLKRLYREIETDKDLLDQEHQLLKRILTRLFPKILEGFFHNPTIAWRQLRVTVITLTFVTLGYYSHLLHTPFKRQQTTTIFTLRGGNR